MEVKQAVQPTRDTKERKINILGLIGPALGVVILLLFLLLPPIVPLTEKGMKVAGIFIFTMIWWVTIGLGWPSVLAIVLFPLVGVVSATDAFANSWGDWLIPFLIGVMGLGGALRVTGFSRRFALWFMSRSFVKGRPWMMTFMLLLACALLGMTMMLTVNCIIFMAIVAPMLEELGYKKGDRYAATAMMGVAWASTSSYIMTPIASPGNLLTISWLQRDVGYNVTFEQWFLWGVPMGLLVFGILFVVYRFWVRPDISSVTEATISYVPQARIKMGATKIEEKITAAIFVAVIIFWILPDVGKSIIPGLSASLVTMGKAVPAVIGACLLCLIHVKGKPILTFDQWMKDSVEWGSMALVAAVALIGDLISDKSTGIPQLLTNVFQPLALNAPGIIFVLIAITWVVLQTNVMANLVSCTLVYSVIIPATIVTGAANPVALAVCIAGASSLAFALPSATTSTTLVVGSGWVPVPFMFKYGVALILPVILLFTFVAYPFACLIFK